MTALWIELHKRALDYMGTNDALYILNFGRRIPRYTTGCACQEFWNNWIRVNPPNYRDYFAWTVKAHNAVNAKLNKPVISVDEATKIYRPTKYELPNLIPTTNLKVDIDTNLKVDID